MTDAMLRSYTRGSTRHFFSVVEAAAAEEDFFADLLLTDETDGFAIDATDAAGTNGGYVSVKDTGTPANDLSNVALDSSNLVQSGTSPKMVTWGSSPYVRWTPHNMFLNSGSPVTQNVTLITGFVYTYGITGAGTLTGSSGASGAATAGAPVTFTATGTTGTFTVSGGTPTTMWINRGPTSAPYIATTGSIRIGIPQAYDTAAAQYGILVEPAGTNVQTRSQEVDDLTAWTSTTTTIAANTGDTTAPDGSATAEKLTNTSSGAYLESNLSVTITADAIHTVSVYVKNSTDTWVRLNLYDAAFSGDEFNGWYNISTGATGTTSTAGAASSVTNNIVSIGDGWYRLSLTGNLNGADTTAKMQIRSVTGDGSSTGVNSVVKYVWGAQIELGSVATSYIPTLGSTVTRARDDIQVTLSTIPFSTSAGTIGIGWKPLNYLAFPTNITYFGTATAGTPVITTGNPSGGIFGDSGSNTHAASGAINAYDVYKYAFASGNSIFNRAGTNGTLNTDSFSPALASNTRAYLGSSPSVTDYIMMISYVVYVPRRVTDGDLPTWILT